MAEILHFGNVTLEIGVGGWDTHVKVNGEELVNITSAEVILKAGEINRLVLTFWDGTDTKTTLMGSHYAVPLPNWFD